jgi:hypothetical protein
MLEEVLAEVLQNLSEYLRSSRGSIVSFTLSRLLRPVLRDEAKLRRLTLAPTVLKQIVRYILDKLAEAGLLKAIEREFSPKLYQLEKSSILWRAIERDPACVANVLVRIDEVDIVEELRKCAGGDCRVVITGCGRATCLDLDCEDLRKLVDVVAKKTCVFDLKIARETMLYFYLGKLGDLEFHYLYDTDTHQVLVVETGNTDHSEVMRQLLDMAGLREKYLRPKIVHFVQTGEKCPLCGGDIVRDSEGKVYCVKCGLDIRLVRKIKS